LFFYLLLTKLTVLIDSDKTTLEVTEVEFCTTRNLHLGDLICVLLELSSSCNGVGDMLIVVGVTRNGETDEVEDTLTLLIVLLIPFESEGTKLAWTNTVQTDHLNDEADTTKVIDLHASALEEVSHVKVHGVATRRHHDTLDARLDHVDGELAHLQATGVHVLREEDLTETNSESESIATTDTTVSGIAVTENLDLLQAGADAAAKELGEAVLKETVVTEAEHTTHVAEAILLGGHGEDIAIAEHLTDDLTKGSAVAAVGLFELLDEPCVLSKASSVEKDGDASLVSQLSDSAEVGHADRLTSSSVVGDGHEDEWNVLSVLSEHGLELSEIDVALEGVLLINLLDREGLKEVGSKEVLRDETVSSSLSLSGIEETVRGDHPWLRNATLLEGAAHSGVNKRLAATTLAHDEHVGRGLTILAKEGKSVRIGGGSVLNLTNPPLLSPVITGAGSDQTATVRNALCRISRKGIESVANSVSKGKEAIVATASLVTTDNAGPLCVSHGSGTTVRQVIDKEHCGWERESIVLSSIKHSFTILLSDFVAPANHIGAVSWLNSTKLLLINCRHYNKCIKLFTNTSL